MGLAELRDPGRYFTNVSRALQDIISKFVYYWNRTSYDNFKLKLCTCAQSHALGTRTKFQLEVITENVIFDIVYFREIILKSSRNISETTPRPNVFVISSGDWIPQPTLETLVVAMEIMTWTNWWKLNLVWHFIILWLVVSQSPWTALMAGNLPTAGAI